MSERKTFTAASIEDAITLATTTLGIPSDRMEYVVKEKGAKGFLGIGSRQAVIEAWIKDDTVLPEEMAVSVGKEEKKPEVREEIRQEVRQEKKPEKTERLFASLKENTRSMAMGAKRKMNIRIV